MKELTEQQVIALGWLPVNNMHHESGEKTFTKKDRNGVSIYATLEHINNFYNKTITHAAKH